MAELPNLDPIFHQPTRTRLAALLRHNPSSFSHLKQVLAVTDGNLDAHLKKLSAAGYLHSQMVPGSRPHTVYSLSETGTQAFDHYKTNLMNLINKTNE